MKNIVVVEGMDIPNSMRCKLAGLSVEEQLKHFVITKQFCEYYGEDKETNLEDLTRSEYLNSLSHRDVLDIITCEGFVVGVHVGIEGKEWAPASCNVFFNTESPKILNWGCKYGGHYYDFVNIYAMYSMVFRPLPGEMNG